MKIIKKAALAYFKNGKMLQVRDNKQDKVFYTLGGNIEIGESDIECLKREAKEEVGCEIEEGSLRFLKEFQGVAHGGGILNVRLYAGNLVGEPKPLSEIVEIGYFDTQSDPKNLSLIAQKVIFPWLKKQGYIN